IFFEMPNVVWILRNLTFWDIFYEHCSYFSPGSLTRLFAKYGFEVLRLMQAFEGQYLWLEARPQSETRPTRVTDLDSPHKLVETIGYFAKHYQDKKATLRKLLLDNEKPNGKRAVIWGAGAKGVTILNTLEVSVEAIEFVVDINPRKQGNYIPGTGQQIVSPDFLVTYAPDTIFVMNPNYLTEIQSRIANMGLRAQLITL
ncbi:MAG: SAM-dependent methyltransferase, partial [Anaerolineales bacterium]|nr:SAM-dependent methyltransferase [Anaerolineales bacterium]